MRAASLLVIPWIGVSFGCGGAGASSPASDGGSPTSTASPTQTASLASDGGSDGAGPSDGGQTASLASDGGSDGSGPSDDAAYPDAALCGETPITFALTLPTWSTGSSFSCLTTPVGLTSSSWLTTWLMITAPDGDELTIDAPCDVVCGKGQCEVADCVSEYFSATASPQTRAWDGTIYATARESPTCPAPGPFDCYAPSCAAPGSYTATMCAAPMGPDAGPDAPCDPALAGTVCTQVTFEWPPPSPGQVVSGALTIGDGG